MYFKITYRNGYCGCDEECYVIADSEYDVWDKNVKEEEYSFYWDECYAHDFIDDTIEDEFNREEEMWRSYHDEIGYHTTVEEITKEEYEDNI